jgi:hypothetical protein
MTRIIKEGRILVHFVCWKRAYDSHLLGVNFLFAITSKLQWLQNRQFMTPRKPQVLDFRAGFRAEISYRLIAAWQSHVKEKL